MYFCVISRRKVYVPIVFEEPNVTGSAYLDAIQLWLIPEWEESEPDNFIWRKDGAPPHWYLSIRDWLNIIVPDQWICRKGSHDKACFEWSSRSLDLTSCDFYLWGFIKNSVYVPPVPADLPDLRHRIEAELSDTLDKVYDELAYRLDVCRVTNGAHIEHS
ncbi:uncharacterized protein TNCV_3809231 [Trichonephila clavipes]|nr:uncharacterized protein TNCV_3809231 [Trichonephila clavipes]